LRVWCFCFIECFADAPLSGLYKTQDDYVKQSCIGYYVQFQKKGESYVATNISQEQIDNENVLYLLINIDGRGSDLVIPPFITDQETIRVRNLKMGLCSAMYGNNGYKSLCSGDFVQKIDGETKRNIANGVLTLGLSTIISGASYDTEPNKANISLAKEGFLINMFSYIESSMLMCKEKYDIQMDKAQLSINQRQEEAKQTKKIEDKFRKNLTVGEETNCGIVVDLRASLVQVQTPTKRGMVWFKKEYIYPVLGINNVYNGCSDSNYTYRSSISGKWIQE
jgi:hypothetical protein